MRLFKVFFPTRVVGLLISEIAIIFGCYFVAAYYATGTPNYISYSMTRGFTA